jgi:hypothetical protein
MESDTSLATPRTRAYALGLLQNSAPKLVWRAGGLVDCQWSSYVTANRIVSSVSAPRKALLEYLPNGAGQSPGIHRHNLGTESA